MKREIIVVPALCVALCMYSCLELGQESGLRPPSISGTTPTAAASTSTASPLCGISPTLIGTVPEPDELCNERIYVDRLLWQTFIALNWPADIEAGRGLPLSPTDPSKFLKKDVPLVWETWKQQWETVDQEKLSAWNSYAVARPPCDEVQPREGEGPIRVNPENWPRLYKEYGGTVLNGINLVKQNHAGGDSPFALAGPLVDPHRNYVRYEVRFNRALYDCVRDGTSAGCSKTKDRISMPAARAGQTGSINVKAAWRELDRQYDDKTDYHHRDVLVLDHEIRSGKPIRVCKQKEMLLVGMHIVFKRDASVRGAPALGAGQDERNNWIWGTFEHAKNAPICAESFSFRSPNGYSHEPAVLRRAPLPPPESREPVMLCHVKESGPTTKKVNRDYARVLCSAESEPWCNYRLQSSHWLVGDAPLPSRWVANVLLEPYSQDDSCMGCHNKQASASDFVWSLEIARRPDLFPKDPWR
ncbi:hypothetical protein WMF37_15370 [Sorangium sp. So ce291]|uniref:hypothetical protein n=1 Tax=Sorangium sp. So ce291 TaxID=3133294 RepID=UPI003F62F755